MSKLSDIQKIVVNLLKEEAKIENIDVSVYTVRYKSELFKKKYKLGRSFYSGIINDFKKLSGTYLCESREIFLFFNNNKYLLSPYLGKEDELIKYIYLAYHEFGHAIQRQKYAKCGTYEKFLFDIEDCIKFFIPPHYDKNHDAYYMELDADYYSINKTFEFFQTHPEFKIYNKDGLEKLVSKYNYGYINYDFDCFFSLFCEIIRVDNTLLNKYGRYIYGIFNSNGTLKSLSELVYNRKAYDMDYKILYSVLSSNEFLDNFDFCFEADYMRNELDNALSYKLQILQSKYDINVSFPLSEARYRNEIDRINKFKSMIYSKDKKII